MSHIANAHAKFLDNYACSQAIFSEYCKDFDIDPKIALSVSAGFAGGMRMGRTCGAVTGALMVLGLRYSGQEPETPEGRQKVSDAVTTFTKRFHEINGSTDCKELLAVDISTSEGMEIAKKKNLFRTACPKFIIDAASLLEEL